MELVKILKCLPTKNKIELADSQLTLVHFLTKENPISFYEITINIFETSKYILSPKTLCCFATAPNERTGDLHPQHSPPFPSSVGIALVPPPQVPRPPGTQMPSTPHLVVVPTPVETTSLFIHILTKNRRFFVKSGRSSPMKHANLKILIDF